MAYIGAEFWDSVKRTHFVIAVRVESEGPMQELHPGDQTWYISEDGCTLEQLPFIDPRTGAPSSKENFKPAVGRLSYTRSPGEARDRICRALGIGRAASPLGKKFNEVFQMGTSMDEIPNFREFYISTSCLSPSLIWKLCRATGWSWKISTPCWPKPRPAPPRWNKSWTMAAKLPRRKRKPSSTEALPFWPVLRKPPPGRTPGRSILPPESASTKS